MKVLYEINEVMEEELKHLCKKEALTPSDVDLIGKMVDVVKDIATIHAMENYDNEGWYKNYSKGYDTDYSYARGTHYPYMNERSYNRDQIGRYASMDDGYSRHSKDEMIDNLKMMMANARTPEERESYRSTIEQMTRQ